MPTIISVLLSLSFIASTTIKAQTNDTKMQWWLNDRFGMFLHFGVYSIGHDNGKPQKNNEHFMFYKQTPVAEYGKLADSLTLVDYNPEAWVKMAKDAGMKYMVITAKHHDGFAMYNSAANDFNIVKKSPYGKDPMVPLAQACKKYGVKLGFYYSLGRDWESPNSVGKKEGSKAGNTWDYPDVSKKNNQKYIDEKVKPQLKELLTQYGPVAVIWFDTPENTTKEQSEDLRTFILSIQPDCIINSRVGNGLGDYRISEQSIAPGIDPNPWEACITMGRNWGYNLFDKNYKSPEQLVRFLVEIVCKGGNLLLNVGPTAKGDFPVRTVNNLKAIGNWMNVNSEAIYGTHPWATLSEYAPTVATDVKMKDAMGKSEADFTSKNTDPDLFFNQKGNIIYLFARSWKERNIVSKSLASLTNIKNISMLGCTQKIVWKNENGNIVIAMPKLPKTDVPVYVFKITAN